MCQNLFGSFSCLRRAADHDELGVRVLRGLCFFCKAARRTAILCNEKLDVKLFHERPVQRVGERPLHGNDIFVGDMGRFTGCDAFSRGQNTGKQPLRRERRKHRKLFCTGRKQDISTGIFEKPCGMHC